MYGTMNIKYSDYKQPHLTINWNTLDNTDYHERLLLHNSKYRLQHFNTRWLLCAPTYSTFQNLCLLLTFCIYISRDSHS